MSSDRSLKSLDLLIVQHETDTPPGTVLAWAKQKNLSFHIWNVAQEPCPYSPSEISALVICGGSMNVFEEAQNPWLVAEKKFIKDCLALKLPIFGLCLGSQLLAETLGGKVFPFNKWEVGFVPVTLLDSPQKKSLEVFHWHQCTFDLPPGAELLATNNFCKNQAFTFGSHVIATQFHPEATLEWIEECASVADERDYQGLVQTKEQMLSSLNLQQPLQNWFYEKLNSWYPFT